MKKHLVLVGGGHAHMVTLANIHHLTEKGHKVTVVGPSDFHYYSGMGPGMLGKTYKPEDIRFATKHVVQKQGGEFIRDKAVRIAPDNKTLFLESGKILSYDVVSFNAGSYVPRDSISSARDNDIYSAKPIERLMEAQKRLISLMSEKKISVSIVGGGPSSAEIAGNVRQLAVKTDTHLPEIRIFAGKKFMSRFPENVQKMVKDTIKKKGICIDETGYVKNVETGKITTASGTIHKTDFIFMALGVRPSGIFENSGLPTGPDKGLLVNVFLQSTAYPDIFGGGDCIYFQESPLDKVGVYAVRENPILLYNLTAALENRPLKPFNPGGDYLLIFNLGSNQGVLRKKWFSLKGRTAFMIKDYIDRKFMKTFQAIE